MRKNQSYITQFPRRLLNPRQDGVFKEIFAQNTKESRLALKSFLESVIGRTITELQVVSNGGGLSFFQQKEVEFDINVTFNDGEAAEIEMQTFRQGYDFGFRAEYLASRLFNNSMKKGERWKTEKRIYQISILDYNYLQDESEALNHFVFRNANGTALAQRMNIIFLELRKLPELTAELIPQLNSAEKWAILLRDADKLEKQKLVMEVAQTEDGIMAAFNILKGMSLIQRLWMWETKRDIRRRDYISNLEGYREEGFQQGVQKGFETGIQKGVLQGVLRGAEEKQQQMVLAMLKDGVEAETIAKWSGMELKKVLELKNGL